MSDFSPNLNLAYLTSGQAQKHITLNEAIRALDARVHLSAISSTITTPPTDALDGQRYLVPTGATGSWAAKTGSVAAWQDGAWAFYTVPAGTTAWVESEARQCVFITGAGWIGTYGVTAGGATTEHFVFQEDLSLSGNYTETTGVIPNRAIVLGVTVTTITAISGAASYDCGINGEQNKFGGSLGIAQGSVNYGVVGPTAFYADTKIRVTANGGAFSGGRVRLSLHALNLVRPTIAG